MTSGPRPELWVCHLGTVEYRHGVALQERVRAARMEGRIPDTLLLLEHSVDRPCEFLRPWRLDEIVAGAGDHGSPDARGIGQRRVDDNRRVGESVGGGVGVWATVSVNVGLVVFVAVGVMVAIGVSVGVGVMTTCVKAS